MNSPEPGFKSDHRGANLRTTGIGSGVMPGHQPLAETGLLCYDNLTNLIGLKVKASLYHVGLLGI